ncbi:hypothetical protein [Polaromonas sp.]|uniref:hypothetical protein n=1 Tax=Polaromonas sp. TaxID=1869339 RepID=UPI0013B69775|nr:hypothetical protein [Polaromonas sp.]NDP64038.1 hypothetical protein [Polaromonas sp.]
MKESGTNGSIMQSTAKFCGPKPGSPATQCTVIDPNPVSRTFTASHFKLGRVKALPLWVLTSAFLQTRKSSGNAEALDGAFTP